MATPRKKVLNPAGVAPPLKPHYSNAVRVESGPLLFIAGQIATDAEGKMVGIGDLRAQATQVLENIRIILRGSGADMEDLLNVTVYVTDLADVPKMNEVYKRLMPNPKPARATVKVAGLIGDAKIEISAIAVKQ